MMFHLQRVERGLQDDLAKVQGACRLPSLYYHGCEGRSMRNVKQPAVVLFT
jgi:hypothetical protein